MSETQIKKKEFKPMANSNLTLKCKCNVITTED